MKKTILNAAFAILILWAAPASAAPKWLTAAPRAIGRAYGNMVTFHDKRLAFEQWATLAVVILDQKTTLDAFHRCPSCVENTSYSLFHGGQYGVGSAVLNVAMAQTFYGTTEQYEYELLKDDPNPHWRALRYAGVIVPVTIHLNSALSNMCIK